MPWAPWGNQTGLGMLLGLALHVAAFLVAACVIELQGRDSVVLIGMLFALGVVQLAYMLPVALLLKRAREHELLQGLAVCAGVTFLLSSACMGLSLSLGACQ